MLSTNLLRLKYKLAENLRGKQVGIEGARQSTAVGAVSFGRRPPRVSEGFPSHVQDFARPGSPAVQAATVIDLFAAIAVLAAVVGAGVLAWRTNRRRLPEITDNLPGVMFRRVRHADGRLSYPYIGGRARALLPLGTDAVSANADRFASYMHPDDRAAWRAAADRSLESMEPFDHETRLRNEAGESRWYRVIAQPRRRGNGDVEWDGLAIDITEQKWTETAMGETEAMLRAVIESIADEVLVKDLNGRLARCNSAGARLHGRTVEEMIGRTAEEIFGPERGASMVGTDR